YAGDDLVVIDRSTDQGFTSAPSLKRVVERVIQKHPGLSVGFEQRRDVVAQRLITAACVCEKPCTLVLRTCTCFVIELLDTAPTLWGHHRCQCASSRMSHARANCQSRITLRGEIFRTSAVSSTLSPPKN